MRLIPLAMVSLVLASCTTGEGSHPVAVGTVAPQLKAWNGRTVLVRGWITGCHKGFECTIADRAQPSSSNRDGDGRLIIDHVPEMEGRLGAVDGKQVLLRARVTDECMINICTDRAPALIPIALVKVY